MKFTKMHGAGNDYVYVNCFSEPLPGDPAALARAVSDRHFGVGADGLVLICPSSTAHAEMRMFNADGSYSENCGNALRCIAKFVYDRGIARANPLHIATGGRVLETRLTLDGGKVDRVQIDMGEPILSAAQIPTTLVGDPPIDVPLNVPLSVPNNGGDRRLNVTCASMGNPHCIVFVDEITDDLVLGAGPLIERHAAFPRRTNVEFVEVIDRRQVRQRTWERGSGETLACGTGACAVCVAGVLSGRTDRQITVHLLGGDLQVEWQSTNNRILMTGPATHVFDGEWNG